MSLASLATLASLLLLTGPVVAAPLPLVPPGPSAGDHARGWVAGLEAVEPRPGAQVPWLRSATAARIHVHSLPSSAEEARPRLVEAAAMILARHGRPFEQPAWDDWFRSRSWYQARPDYSPGLLSEGEREALDLLLQAWSRLETGGPTRR